MKKEDIIFIEYDGNGNPFQVYTRDLTGFDFFIKEKLIQCNWCSCNIRPFISKRIKAETGKKHKIWFWGEEFRPTSGSGNDKLNDNQIFEYGYQRIRRPKFLSEIIEAIENE